MERLNTHVGTHTSDTSRLVFRGRDTLAELVGHISFTEMIFLAASGRLPTPVQTRILDACLVILADHGITPSALVARLVAESVPEDIQVPIAAGLLMIGNKYVGTMVGAGLLFADGVKSGKSPDVWATETVADYTAKRKRFAGYGHPDYSPYDPRAVRLFEVAREAGVEGTYMRLALALEDAIEQKTGRRLVLNATGAIGALLSEIDFPVEAMRGVAVISRSAGLLAHALEERSSSSGARIVGLVQDNMTYEDEVL